MNNQFKYYSYIINEYAKKKNKINHKMIREDNSKPYTSKIMNRELTGEEEDNIHACSYFKDIARIFGE